MTISYQIIMASATPIAIAKVLFRWKGSVFKLMWKDLLFYILTFYLVRAVYELLSPSNKRAFLYLVEYCQRYGSTVPVTMVLGLYLNRVLTRFFDQFMSLAWPYRIAFELDVYIGAGGVEGRLHRRTVIRYLMLSYVLVMSNIAPAVKKRFPTLGHMTNAGLLNKKEQEILESITGKRWDLPIVWACNLIAHAYNKKLITDPQAYDILIKDCASFRFNLFIILCYDHVQLPLCYTQVVTLVLYVFFGACLFSRQSLERRTISVELLFPFYTLCQFAVYMGLLKTAEEALNPFGEDENDFEINSLIDSNLTDGLHICQGTRETLPPLQKDKFWFIRTHRIHVPYTVATFSSNHASIRGPGQGIRLRKTIFKKP